jgi:lipopolysaccharide/colanic/teichoic acid biosynthesis glycosyltransferase
MSAPTSTAPDAVPAPAPANPAGEQRVLLVEELYRRYAKDTSGPGGWWRRLRFYRKKYAWVVVVGGARAVKRAIDFVAALAGLLLLSPLFLGVALLIKLTDGGRILFWQARVGRWGREFPFPKFRSMVANAEEIKQRMVEVLKHLRAELACVAEEKPDLDPEVREGLRRFAREPMAKSAKLMERFPPAVRTAIEGFSKDILTRMVDEMRDLDPRSRQILAAMKNDHTNSITFKMRNDPRVTWIGKIIRKLSIDELPQLWCVLRGDMSLVGPRPPVPSEVAEYTLADRRRLDVKPGLTCLWQVETRVGDFQEQVKRDITYINSQSVWLDIKVLLKTIPAVLLGKGAY